MLNTPLKPLTINNINPDACVSCKVDSLKKLYTIVKPKISENDNSVKEYFENLIKNGKVKEKVNLIHLAKIINLFDEKDRKCIVGGKTIRGLFYRTHNLIESECGKEKKYLSVNEKKYVEKIKKINPTDLPGRNAAQDPQPKRIKIEDAEIRHQVTPHFPLLTPHTPARPITITLSIPPEYRTDSSSLQLILNFQKNTAHPVITTEVQTMPAQAPSSENLQTSYTMIDAQNSKMEVQDQPVVPTSNLYASVAEENLMQLIKKHSGEFSFKKANAVLKKEMRNYKNQMKIREVPEHLTVALLSQEIGNGVFLNAHSKTIKKGSFIGLYTGEYRLIPANDKSFDNSYAIDTEAYFILDKNEISHHFKENAAKYQSNDEFMLKIDAKDRGNFTRMINHSSLKPNCNLDEPIILEDGSIEVPVIAIEDILPGQQLGMDYHGVYWKKNKSIPEIVFPDTYTINEQGKVVCNPSKKYPFETLEIREYLKSFRRPFAKTNDGSLPKKDPDYLNIHDHWLHAAEEFSEQVRERGITRHFALEHINEELGYGIFLRPTEPMIAKGSFIGIYAGSLQSKRPLDETYTVHFPKKTDLLIDASKKGNFTREINFANQKNSNVRLLPINFEKQGMQLLVIAKEDIYPGEQLLMTESCKISNDMDLNPRTLLLS